MDPVMVNSEQLWHGMDAGKMVDGCFDDIGPKVDGTGWSGISPQPPATSTTVKP